MAETRAENELTATISVEKHKTWILSGYNLSVEAVLTCPEYDNKLSQIPVTAVLSDFLKNTPELILSLDNIEILDLRGRPLETFQQEHHSASDEKRKEELFFAKGVMLKNAESEEEEEKNKSPFWARLTTGFERYEGLTHIVHRTEPSLSSSLSTFSALRSIPELLEMNGVVLSEARLGVEQFRRRSLGFMFGLGPIIVNRFYLEISEDKIWLFSRQDGVRERRLCDQRHLAAFCQVLEQTGLYQGLMEEILSS